MSESTRTEKEPMAEFQSELSAFRSLIDLLLSYDVHVSHSDRGGLAFIVDAYRKEFGDEWEQAFDVFLGDLDEHLTRGGKSAGTALLAQELNARYALKLKNEIQRETDPTRINNLNLLQGRVKDNWQIRERGILNQEMVPIGSVIGEHKPLWYPLTQK